MRILVDEHIPLMTIASLRALGHDVKDILRGTADEGMGDQALWTLAQHEMRLSITTAKALCSIAQYSIKACWSSGSAGPIDTASMIESCKR